jgi:YHS domain-containing protein
MVVDPVCSMSLDPAEAAASADYDGTRVYFCSEGCHRRFMADPESYRSALQSSRAPGTCDVHASHAAPDLGALLGSAAKGVLAAALLLSFYFGVLALVSGWTFTLEQFADYWPFIVTLAIGFGIQVGLFVYLRRVVHAAGSGKVVAATGTTSGIAMVSCCSHYLVNLLPVLGATGLASLVGQYQIELFWFGIAANLIGIAYIGRRLVSFARGAYA